MTELNMTLKIISTPVVVTLVTTNSSFSLDYNNRTINQLQTAVSGSCSLTSGEPSVLRQHNQGTSNCAMTVSHFVSSDLVFLVNSIKNEQLARSKSRVPAVTKENLRHNFSSIIYSNLEYGKTYVIYIGLTIKPFYM